MEELYWYVYQGEQQLGPFAAAQVAQMITSSMLQKDAFVFRVGWKDWRPLEDSTAEIENELGLVKGAGLSSLSSNSRRKGAPRASIAGKIVVHNNTQLTMGSGVNISWSGLFVETKEDIFQVGERLKITVTVKGLTPFNAVAVVIRYNSDAKYPVGYGLKYESIDPKVVKEIEALVLGGRQAKAV